MVVGAMLLSGSSAGLGIPKSPSFHSGLELAAAKDFNFHMSSNSATITTDSESITGGVATMPASQHQQQQLQQDQKQGGNNKTNNGTSIFKNMENTLKSKNNPFLTATSNMNGSGATPSPAVVTTPTSITGSPGRTRDRNVFITPSATAAMSLPLLRGRLFCFNESN